MTRNARMKKRTKVRKSRMENEAPNSEDWKMWEKCINNIT